MISHFLVIFSADDPDDDMTKGKPAFDADPHHVAAGKPEGIKDSQDRNFFDLRDHGGNYPEPDDYFYESKPEGNPAPALDDTDGPQGAKTDIHYAGQKDRDAGEKYRYA